MSLYFYAILFLIIIILFWRKFQGSRVIYLKNLLLPFATISFILCLVLFSKTAVSAASQGITLWLNVVFPSLFPFFVASQLLNKTGFVRAIGILFEPIMRPLFNVPGCGSFALAVGITSGYPLGAKVTTQMREEKLLTKIEAERLLTFTNNSGPLFIIGAVSVGMFKIPELGLFLLACHIAACVTVGIVFRFYKRTKEANNQVYSMKLLSRFKYELITVQKNSSSSFGNILGEAVRDSVTMLLAIGGFITFFSVIINMLLETGFVACVSSLLSPILAPIGIHKDIISSLISGFFEITTGTSMVSNSKTAPLVEQLTAASMIIGWAGLSVHSQVLSIINKTDLSIKPYLAGKFLQGIFSAFYTYVCLKTMSLFNFEVRPAFLQLETTKTPHWINNFLTACENLLATFVIIALGILLSVLINFIRNANKKRLF
ncbi:MAG: sporulation integral membrane protein YlbJ [Clostridia bacterium]|nr:sporulation integral membrane protein YlbJ [Clostridia bacterium]